MVPKEISQLSSQARGAVVKAFATTTTATLNDKTYWSKIPPIEPDGIEIEFDDGEDGCMPAGWYITGTERGFPVAGQEYGPYKTEQAARKSISPDFKGSVVTLPGRLMV